MGAVPGRSTRSLAIMWKHAVLVTWVPMFVGAAATCTVINPQSVVDQAFVSEMATSSIAHNRPRPDWICYAESDERSVRIIRSKVHEANQPECATFASPADVAAVESALIVDAIRTWREAPVKLCYLATDGRAVRRAADRATKK